MRNDGGQAFPGERVVDIDYLEAYKEPTPGMSLRDWFAGMALASLGELWYLRDGVTTEEVNQNQAEAAYLLADAMLAERGRR